MDMGSLIMYSLSLLIFDWIYWIHSSLYVNILFCYCGASQSYHTEIRAEAKTRLKSHEVRSGLLLVFRVLKAGHFSTLQGSLYTVDR